MHTVFALLIGASVLAAGFLAVWIVGRLLVGPAPEDRGDIIPTGVFAFVLVSLVCGLMYYIGSLVMEHIK